MGRARHISSAITMKKLAIIGASSFQNPLILKAKDMGIETHVFAWECGDVGEKSADFFHPISIAEKDAILQTCREIGVDGIASIGSDFANVTVAHVADAMGLTANSVDCVERSTNKHAMRRAFEAHGDPSPRSVLVDADFDLSILDLSFPIIVKPADRSGSRGITKLASEEGLQEAIAHALSESFSDTAVVEEYVSGSEYSVEVLSWEGVHTLLAITEKFTTGAPCFIEMGHLEPARVSSQVAKDIEAVVMHALDSLGVMYGASHVEVKVSEDGAVRIIEIGSRMGGDCIGSDLVRLSTGYDFVEAVIDVALGIKPPAADRLTKRHAAVRFIFSDDDKEALERLRCDAPGMLAFVSHIDEDEHDITDSSSRYGYFIFSSDSLEDVEPYLPSHQYFDR